MILCPSTKETFYETQYTYTTRLVNWEFGLMCDVWWLIFCQFVEVEKNIQKMCITMFFITENIEFLRMQSSRKPTKLRRQKKCILIEILLSDLGKISTNCLADWTEMCFNAIFFFSRACRNFVNLITKTIKYYRYCIRLSNKCFLIQK